MNIVDSSGWIEYFTDGPNAAFFAEPIERAEELVVPSIILYEVCKHIARRRSEIAAIPYIAIMSGARVADLTSLIAHLAANLSLEHELPMADAVILATARLWGATVWTQDDHFKGLEGVRYRRRKESS